MGKIINLRLRNKTEAANAECQAMVRNSVINQPLVAAMLNGDSDAFQSIYLYTYGRLKEFLTILLHSKEDAEEVIQNIFLYIWENRTKYDSEQNFEGLLYTVAKRQAFKLINSRRLNEKIVKYKANAGDDLAQLPDELVMADELLLMINLYIDNLSPQRKRVFELRRIEGKSIKEIAQIMDLSTQTVKNYLQTVTNGLKDLVTLFMVLFVSQ